jgi:MraZ protein
MSEAFRGEFTQKVDGKARVSIPAAFRRVLEAGDPDSTRKRIVIVYGDERRKFAECYTVAGAQRLEAMIRKLPLGSPARRLLERNMITLSVTLEIDEDGRIVLPAKVREKTGLSSDGGEAVFAGALDTFQLWKAETYEADIRRAAEEELAALPGDMDILSLLGGDAPEV